MTHEWQVMIDGAAITLRGFRHAAAARVHVEKHFLSRVQRWDLVCAGSPMPEDFRVQLATVDGDVVKRELLDTAAARYQDIVQDHTAAVCQSARYIHQYIFRNRPRGEPYPTLAIVTASGIFAAFSDGPRSDLRTALRPEPKYRGPSITNRHFRAAARDKLNKIMSPQLGLGKA